MIQELIIGNVIISEVDGLSMSLLSEGGVPYGELVPQMFDIVNRCHTN